MTDLGALYSKARHDSRLLIYWWQAVPENAQVSCMPIEHLLREPIGLGCAVGALQLESRATA